MVASLDPEVMVQTPAGGSGEAFGVLDVALGASPFVFLVGVLAGSVAAFAVWPVAVRLSDDRSSLETEPRTYLRGPVLVGGTALLTSVQVDLVLSEQVGPVGPALAGRLLLLGGCLSAVAHWWQYRDATAERRHVNGYAYAAFVLVWTALSLGLYASWL